jgi:hypothetical protein
MKINVTEMKKLRFACGHTRMDKIENKDNRNKTKVTEMHRKIQEKRLRWYGHIQRREEFVTKRVLRMEVEGKEAEGNGYPEMDKVHKRGPDRKETENMRSCKQTALGDCDKKH